MMVLLGSPIQYPMKQLIMPTTRFQGSFQEPFHSDPIYVPKTLHTKLDGFSIGFLQNKSHLTNNDHNFLNINRNYAYFHIIGTWWPPGLFFLFVNQMEHLMATRCLIFFLLYSSCTWWPLGPIFWITDKMATWWPPNQFFLHCQLRGHLVATKCSFFLSSTRMAPNGD